MIKWISLVLSFLFGARSNKDLNLKGLAMEVYDEAIYRSRKPVGLFLLALASVFFICGGMMVALLDITRQYDTRGWVYPGATMWSGISLAVLSIIGSIYIFTKAWPKSSRPHHFQAEHSSSEPRHPGLDEALSLLIMDYIEERKTRRNQTDLHRKNPPPPPYQAGKGHSTSSHSNEGKPPTGFA